MHPPHFILKFMANRLDKKILSNGNNIRKVQQGVLNNILHDLANTKVAKKYSLENITSIEEFNRLIPVTTDLDYRELIDSIMNNNESNFFQSKPLEFLARTSGSTSDSKYIPYTKNLIKNFKRFSTNIIFKFCKLTNSYDLLDSNILVSPGNISVTKNDQGLIIGQGTGIMTLLAPKFTQKIIRPSLEILESSTGDNKLDLMIKESFSLDIRSFSGMPTFAIAILEAVLIEAKSRGIIASNILDIWPNLKAYSYSGSSIKPYEEKLRELTGPDIPYLEVYSATETPIGFQYELNKGGLCLDLESAFFQFQESDQALDSKKLTADQVKLGKHYRILMTTYGGLLSYRIGDVVEFLSLNPPLFKVLGREKEELNMTGNEQFSLSMIKKFLQSIYKKYNFSPKLFFVCPYLENTKKGYHWCFEVEESEYEVLSNMSNDIKTSLDEDLKASNHGYLVSREADFLLISPMFSIVPVGTIKNYILAEKVFGQGKFLSVYNTSEETDKFFTYVDKSKINIKSFK